MIQFLRPPLTLDLDQDDIIAVPDQFKEDLDEMVVLVINSLAASDGTAMPAFRDALGPARDEFDSPASPDPDDEDDWCVESSDESLDSVVSVDSFQEEEMSTAEEEETLEEMEVDSPRSPSPEPLNDLLGYHSSFYQWSLRQMLEPRVP